MNAAERIESLLKQVAAAAKAEELRALLEAADRQFSDSVRELHLTGLGRTSRPQIMTCKAGVSNATALHVTVDTVNYLLDAATKLNRALDSLPR